MTYIYGGNDIDYLLKLIILAKLKDDLLSVDLCNTFLAKIIIAEIIGFYWSKTDICKIIDLSKLGQ